MKIRTVVIWIVIVLVIWYIGYYYYPPKHVAILQTTLGEFVLDLLNQRQPIVFSDAVMDWGPLKKAWFPYHRIVEDATVATTDWIRSPYKYLMIQLNTDHEILLYPAYKKLTQEKRPPEEDTLLAIKLKAHQILLLPHRWFFYVPDATPYQWMGIHDFVTRWLPA